MPWWVPILIYAGLTVIGELLRPRPKYRDAAASSLGELRTPTSEESRSIPIIFGTCHLKAPNVLWYGDYFTTAIKEKVDSGSIFGGSKKVTVGYSYYLGFQYGLCMGPIDEVVEIRYDDKALPVSPPIKVATGQNVIRIAVGAGAWTSATIAPGNYANREALAVAAQAAMVAAIAGDWKVVNGFRVVKDRCDRLRYAIQVSGVATKYDVTVPAGGYRTGRELAAAIAKALNANEAAVGARGTFSVTYNDRAGAGTSKFRITFAQTVSGYEGWWLYGKPDGGFDWSKTIHPTIGFLSDSNRNATGINDYLDSDVEVNEGRYVFAYSGTDGKLRLSSSEFTARALFGFTQVGTPVDATIGLKVADYASSYETGTAYSPEAEYTRCDIVAPNLFGGERAEGGIVGRMDVHHGTLTQIADEYLEEKIGSSLPAYRGLCYAVARRMYIGTNLYIKPVSFVLRRCPNSLGLAGGKENIGGDANPAAMLYEILTDSTYSISIPPAMIDSASFLACGDTLATEALGLSMQFDATGDAMDWVEEILRHVDGVIFEDPTTGLLKMALARYDYVVANLPLVDKSVAGVVKYERPSWDELRNAVRVKYIDRSSDFMERMLKAQNLAAIQARGGDEVIEEIPFTGISNATAAQKVAARALKAISHPVAKVELTTNRKVWDLRPGSVFRLTWSPLGITDLPFRVAKVSTGTLEEGDLTIEAIEDIFGAPWTAYTPPTAPSWDDPATLPPELLAVRADEVPYNLLDADDLKIMTLGVATAPTPTDGLTMGYEVWSDPDGGDAYRLTEKCLSPTPSGRLVAGIGVSDTAFDLTDDFDLASIESISAEDLQEGRNVLLIENEQIAFRYIDLNADGTYAISGAVRGVGDTVPAAHAIDARAWVVTGGVGIASPTPYPAGAVVKVKLLPFNRRGTRDIAESSALSVTIAQRSLRPFSPANLSTNGLLYPTNVNGSLLTFSWNHRNRLADWSYSDGGVTPTIEPGCTYTIRLYNEVGTLVKTATGITGTSYAWSSESSDSGLGRLNGIVTAKVVAVRTADGLESAYPLEDVVDCAGWGSLWGDYYGGAAG